MQTTINTAAVFGAGTMGSGIAQKMATEGLDVVLVDQSQQRAEAGKQRIAELLQQGVERGIFRPEQVREILARIRPAGGPEAAAEADLVVEAVFEDLGIKQTLFQQLDGICKPEAILATNTSSFLVAAVAGVTARPERVVGLHYFYHPAKNRLVEVVGHAGTDPDVLRRAWQSQQRIGKTPIACQDAPGFVVNRFFVPWLNEAVRLHEEGLGIATIEAAAKRAFGVGMGPFELMNVTGVPIALHAASSLAEKLGAFYAPAAALQQQVDAGEPWPLAGEPDSAADKQVESRLWGAVLYVVGELLSAGVAAVDAVDIGARVGLRWPAGPVETLNSWGIEPACRLAEATATRYGLELPSVLQERRRAGTGFEIRMVTLSRRDDVAVIELNRPDKLNALSPEVLTQLSERFEEALALPGVRGVILQGAGKAFVAGADVAFFVEKIKAEDPGAIRAFAAAGQTLFEAIETAAVPVVCRLDGLALGGGAELALACDAIVATPSASIGFPETGIGIYPGLGGTQRLTRRVGLGEARRLLYTGTTLDARALAELGLVREVVEPDSMDAALKQTLDALAEPGRAVEATPAAAPGSAAAYFAATPVREILQLEDAPPDNVAKDVRKLRRKAPLALQAVERLTALAAESSKPRFDAELEELEAIFTSADALEGMQALLQGRKPSFSGR